MLIFGGWLIAATSTLGALFFSEVMELPPCVLCWYQRIFMFPLAILCRWVFFPSIERSFVMRCSGTGGWLIALFHVLLAVTHSGKASGLHPGCAVHGSADRVVGFLTIPLLSFVAFSAISALMIAARYRSFK